MAKKTAPPASYWDKLPFEMKEAVLEYASPLTRMLHGRLGPVAQLDAVTSRKLWREALEADWTGDLRILPSPDWLSSSDIVMIVSRSMHDRLGELFPESTETNPTFEQFDCARNFYDDDTKRNTDRMPISAVPANARLLHAAMHNMWLDVLEDAIERHPIALAHDAIAHNHADLLKHLVQTGAVDLHRLKLVRYAEWTRLDPHLAMDVAAARGNLNVLKLLHEEGSQACSTHAMDAAARNGHFDIVKFLHENRKEGCTVDAMDAAARNGHFDIVKFLHANRSEGCTTAAMDSAAARGHLGLVMWLHQNRIEGCTQAAMDRAAANGFTDIVAFLHQQRTEGCTEWAINDAAANGHIDIVTFLLVHRTEGFTHFAVEFAASDHVAATVLSSVDEQQRRSLFERLGILVPQSIL